MAMSDGLGVSEQMAMFMQQHGVHRICVDPARPPRAVAGWRGVAVTAWWRGGGVAVTARESACTQ